MPRSDCPDCSGTGFRIVEKDGLTAAERCNCDRSERASRVLARAGIPRSYLNDTLDNFVLPAPEQNPVAYQAMAGVMVQVRMYAAKFPDVDKPGLLLVGDTGTGKTHLAVAVLKRLIEAGHDGVFFDYQNLLDRIRSSYDDSSGASDREAYREAMETEVVALDDLGAHRVTEWVEDTVTSIITHRCNNGLPLIVTTNLPDPDMGSIGAHRSTFSPALAEHRITLADRIGARARSRLFEMCKIVRMPKVGDYRVSTAR
jgi:DNA replication protein DnaC